MCSHKSDEDISHTEPYHNDQPVVISFYISKNQALNLTMHITTEERRQAYKEKYGQAGNQRWVS